MESAGVGERGVKCSCHCTVQWRRKWNLETALRGRNDAAREGGMILCLLLLALLCGGVSAGSHSLRFLNTLETTGSEVLKFTIVGYVDEEQIDYYDSVLGKKVPRQQWMAESQGPDYWEQETQVARDREQCYKALVPILIKQTNQTQGSHTIQATIGCEIREDGTTTGFFQVGWDGLDFITFDKDRMMWVTPVPWGVITKNEGNKDTDGNRYWKGYLEQDCVKWLQEYIKAGESHLEPNPPEVYFTASEDDRHLSCVATGFYPSSIDVTLLQDGRTLEETHSHGILPNHNNTYQLTRTVQVEPMETAEFSCRVEHRGLPEPLVLSLGSKPNSIPNWIIAIVVVLVILVAVIAVVVAYKKKAGCFSAGNNGYNPTKTSDKGESSSNSSAMA